LTFKRKQMVGELHKPLLLEYLVHIPTISIPPSGFPLILSLHGAGQRGHDLSLLEDHGLQKYVNSQNNFPYLVCSPQCPTGDTWALYLDELLALLDEIRRLYPADPKRIYLTGLSMGGNGTWLLASKAPKRFAAAIPICGWGDWIMDFPERVTAMKDVPTWAFHGEIDDVIPVEESQKMVNALTQAGGDAKLTIFPEIAHESWDLAYNHQPLYTWLSKQWK